MEKYEAANERRENACRTRKSFMRRTRNARQEGVHESENACRDRSSRVGKHMLGDQCDSVQWIVSVSATIVRVSGKQASGEVFTRWKTYVGRGVHASGSMCTTDSVLLGHHSIANGSGSHLCRYRYMSLDYNIFTPCYNTSSNWSTKNGHNNYIVCYGWLCQ